MTAALAGPGATGAGDPLGSRTELTGRVASVLTGFLTDRCAEEVRDVPGAEVLTGLLMDSVRGGKYVRSTFAYLGWRCGAPDSPAAVRAAASMELLHACGLLQDDVMDRAVLRRGRPAARVALAEWHREQCLDGDAERFGDSAATLLGDLCLIWAERLWRESGLPAAALERAWPRYDALRGELAVGQFADLVNGARRTPGLAEVLAVARRKSGDYTVRGPLELGAVLAGGPAGVVRALGGYGTAVGEAFQLRDDLLGVFGRPATTGKPAGDDLRERKATTIVVVAREAATPVQRDRLDALLREPRLDEAAVARCRDLIAETGAVRRVEAMIERRIGRAERALADGGIAAPIRRALAGLAVEYTQRAA